MEHSESKHVLADVSALILDTNYNYTGTEATVSTGQYISTEKESFSYQVADPEATDHHLITAGGVKLYVQTDPKGRLNVKSLGAVGDGNTDDTVALQAAANTGSPLLVPDGTYRVTDSIVFPGDMHMEFEDDAKIFADTGVYSEKYVLVARGSATQIGELDTPVEQGSTSLSFATTQDLSADDTIMIFNPTDSSFSGFRDYYRAGEFGHIADMTETTVTLQNPLYDDYSAAEVDIYKVSPISVDLINPRIESNGSPLGLILMEYARNPQITNPQMQHANNSAICIKRSMDGEIFGGNVVNAGDGGSDYGLSIGNSQNITVHGGSWYGRRHGVATGGDDEIGSVPSREINFIGADISNDPLSGTHAADVHGNTELSGFYNCVIRGGLSPQGADINIVDNSFYGGLSNGAMIYAGEVLGGKILITGNTFHALDDPQASGRGVIDFGGNSGAIGADTTRDLVVEFTENTVVSDALGPMTTLIYIRNSGSDASISVDVSNNNFDVNDFGRAVWLRLASGSANSDFLIFDNNELDLSGKSAIYADTQYLSSLPGDEQHTGSLHNGTTGNDTLTGSIGQDTLHGGEGDDALFGDDAHDILAGGTGNDEVHGGSGNDTIFSSSGADIIDFGFGSDILYLTGDTIYTEEYGAINTSSYMQVGTQAKVTLEGFVRIHTVIDGGSGFDILELSDVSEAFFLDDAYSGFHASLSLTSDGIGNASIPRMTNIEEIRGMGGDDIIDLTSQNYSLENVSMIIDGGEGNDVIWGSDANESISGGSGNDTIFGGVGADVLIGNDGADVFEFTRTSTNTTVADYDVEEGDMLHFYNTGHADFDASSVALTENGITISYMDTVSGTEYEIAIILAQSPVEFNATLPEILDSILIS